MLAYERSNVVVRLIGDAMDFLHLATCMPQHFVCISAWSSAHMLSQGTNFSSYAQPRHERPITGAQVAYKPTKIVNPELTKQNTENQQPATKNRDDARHYSSGA